MGKGSNELGKALMTWSRKNVSGTFRVAFCCAYALEKVPFRLLGGVVCFLSPVLLFSFCSSTEFSESACGLFLSFSLPYPPV